MNFWQYIKYFFLVIFVPHSRVRMEWQMLRLLNKDRKDFNLSTLSMQYDLRRVARNHSRDMAEKDYFEHVNLKGDDPADRLKLARVTDTISGENLAKIGGYDNPVEEAEIGLMRSPGHRANILNKNFNCVGVGIVKSKEGVYYFTQNFARRYLRFTKKVPKRILLKKGLKIRGVCIEKVFGIYYKVTNEFTGETVFRNTVKTVNHGFDFDINFTETGRFEIEFYVLLSANPSDAVLSNSFAVKVKKWWFWF